MFTRACRCLLFLLAVAFAAAPAHADYPDHPIRLIVPFPPGGTVDLMGRLTSQILTETLRQSVVVENYGGAGGAIGGQRVAQAAPDGYTLLMGSTSTLSINPFFQQVGYDPLKDFTPITLVAFVPHVLVVNPSLPVHNLKEFIAYAKANKGKLNFGSSGIGTPHQVAGEMFNEMTGVDMVHVPYKGTAPALTDLMSGRVAFMSLELDIAMPYIKANQIRVLGIATKERNPVAPDIPTIAEAGLPGFEVTSWYGAVAPKGVPQPIVATLAGAIAKRLETPEMKEKLKSMGATPVGGTSAQFAAFLVNEKAKWGAVIAKAGAAGTSGNPPNAGNSANPSGSNSAANAAR
jgi:tripartite-type tricarboxylate transporter receptor subunit TctC